MKVIFNKGLSDETSLNFTSVLECFSPNNSTLELRNEGSDLKTSMLQYCEKILKLNIKTIHCYIDEADDIGVLFTNYNIVSECKTTIFQNPKKEYIKRGILILSPIKEGEK